MDAITGAGPAGAVSANDIGLPGAARVETIGNATLYLGDGYRILPILGRLLLVTDPQYEFDNSGGGEFRAARGASDQIVAEGLDQGFDHTAIRPANEAEIASKTVLPALEATVATQAGVIATLEGKTAAYWQTEVVAGGRAQIRMYADGYGGAVDIITDVIRMGSGPNPAMRIVGNRPFFSGDIEVGGAVRVGNYRIPLALQSFQLALADGEVAAFGLNIGTYDLLFDASALSPLTSGQAYDTRALNKTGTGFTMSAKKTTPATPSTITSTSAAYPGTGPTGQMHKASAADAVNAYYSFNYSVNWSVGGTMGPQPIVEMREVYGVATFYINAGSGWVEVGSESLYFAGNPGDSGTSPMVTSVYYANAIGQHGGYEFGMTVESYGGTLNAFMSLASFGSVVYQAPGSGGSSSTASPNGEKVIVTVQPKNVAT